MQSPPLFPRNAIVFNFNNRAVLIAFKIFLLFPDVEIEIKISFSFPSPSSCLEKTFSKPNHAYLDEVFDPHIRSETLLEMMKCEKNMEKSIIQDVTKGEMYYIIHPVLKHIAILKCINY